VKIVTLDYKVRVLASYLPTTDKLINQSYYASTTLWSNLKPKQWHTIN